MNRQKNKSRFVSLSVKTDDGCTYPMQTSEYCRAPHEQTFAIDAIREIIDTQKDDRFTSKLPVIIVRENFCNFCNDSEGPTDTAYFVFGMSYKKLVELLSNYGR